MTDPVERDRMSEDNDATTRQTVWREGDRIRCTDGTGYGDIVSDGQILEHILRHDKNDPLFEPFARAVLAIREFERAAEAVQR